MKTKKLLLVAFIALFISCNQSSVFKKFDNMPEDNRWLNSDVKEYTFTIDDDATLYNINLKLSHVFGYQFASIPINFKIVSPDGTSENINIDLKLKDTEGKEIGDCAGDICDLTYKVKEKTKLQKGEYKVLISNNFKVGYLPNIIGIGLEISK